MSLNVDQWLTTHNHTLIESTYHGNKALFISPSDNVSSALQSDEAYYERGIGSSFFLAKKCFLNDGAP